MSDESLQKRVQCGGAHVDLRVDAAAPILRVLRQQLGLSSVTWGCKNTACGSCRVLINGELRKACITPWSAVPDGALIEAYEQLREDPAAQVAVAQFHSERPSRCELCVGALGVVAVHLARAGHAQDPAAVEAMLAGATCQCTGRASLRRSLLKHPLP